MKVPFFPKLSISKFHMVGCGSVVVALLCVVGYLRLDQLYNHMDPESIRHFDNSIGLLKPLKFETITWKQIRKSEVWLDEEKLDCSTKSGVRIYELFRGFDEMSAEEKSQLRMFLLPRLHFIFCNYLGDQFANPYWDIPWSRRRDDWKKDIELAQIDFTVHNDVNTVYRYRWFPKSENMIVEVEHHFHTAKVGKKASMSICVEGGRLVIRDLQDGRQKVLEYEGLFPDPTSRVTKL